MNIYIMEGVHIAMKCVIKQSVTQVAWSYISVT